MNSITRGLERFKRKGKDRAERGIETTTDLLDNQMNTRVAVDSGQLRSAIQKQYSGLEGQVMVDAGIAYWLWYVEHGTGIHASPKGPGSRAKQIPWTYFKDGRFYTTFGMRAQPFIYPSVDVARQYFKKYFSD